MNHSTDFNSLGAANRKFMRIRPRVRACARVHAGGRLVRLAEWREDGAIQAFEKAIEIYPQYMKGVWRVEGELYVTRIFQSP